MRTPYFIILFVILFWTCSDIIVPDISKEKINLVAPADHAVSNQNLITFIWDAVKDADEYQLVIVNPQFDSILEIVLDTFLTETNFVQYLQAGDYQWEVRGLNDAYTTLCCSTFDLSVKSDSSTNLINQSINLQSPISDFATNNPNINFIWQDLPAADRYIFQLGLGSINNQIEFKELEDNFTSFALPQDGTYFWRVRAESTNSQTFTTWSNANFQLDQIAPTPPSLLFPLNGEEIMPPSQNPDFQWISSSDSFQDTLYIYADVNEILLLNKLVLTTQELNLEDENIALGSDDYFWKVVSVDKAGNASPSSELRQFFVP